MLTSLWTHWNKQALDKLSTRQTEHENWTHDVLSIWRTQHITFWVWDELTSRTTEHEIVWARDDLSTNIHVAFNKTWNPCAIHTEHYLRLNGAGNTFLVENSATNKLHKYAHFDCFLRVFSTDKSKCSLSFICWYTRVLAGGVPGWDGTRWERGRRSNHAWRWRRHPVIHGLAAGGCGKELYIYGWRRHWSESDIRDINPYNFLPSVKKIAQCAFRKKNTFNRNHPR